MDNTLVQSLTLSLVKLSLTLPSWWDEVFGGNYSRCCLRRGVFFSRFLIEVIRYYLTVWNHSLYYPTSSK